MTRMQKSLMLGILVAGSLACGVISNPLTGVKNAASTAEALASAIPTGLPEVSKYLNPQGAPVSDWNGIPIMSEATAGEEFGKGTYSYRVSGQGAQDIQAFYNDKLKALGWSSPFSAQGGGEGGFMLFTKESQVLTITITKTGEDSVVLLTLQ